MSFLQKGKIVYSDNKITNGIKYTNEYRNNVENSQLLPSTNKNLDVKPSTSLSAARDYNKFSRNINSRGAKTNKSMDKRTSSLSFHSYDIKFRYKNNHKQRRNLNITSSINFNPLNAPSKFDGSEHKREVELISNELIKLENSLENKNNQEFEYNLDLHDNSLDQDIRIHKLISDSK